MFKIGEVKVAHYPVLLAPMEDVTDPPFRRICKSMGADMVYTEFISSEGLIRDAQKSLMKLDIFEEERPVGIQIFGHEKESMIQAAQYAAIAEPDLIDINWGCPVKKVVRKGAGSGILRDIPKMVEITKAVVESVNLPVTVKTRLGWDESDKPIVEIAERLQDVGVAALTIHGRTRSQLYAGESDWRLIAAVKENQRMHIPIIGNGDITSAEVAMAMRQKYGVDAIMVGRGAIGNPWLFSSIKHYFECGEVLPPPTLQERITVCRQHLVDSIEWKGERTAVYEMRKHYGKYFSALRGIKPYRMALVAAKSVEEVENIFGKMIAMDISLQQ